MQHYRQQAVQDPLLTRVRNHLVYYAQRGGNLRELEQMVLSQNMAPVDLLKFIESKVPAPPGWQGPPGSWGSGAGPGPGAQPRPGMGMRPPGPPGAAPAAPTPLPQVKCKYCGAMIPPTASECPSCSAPTS